MTDFANSPSAHAAHAALGAVATAMPTSGPEPLELQLGEEALAAREIEMALSEAQLRGQEAHVAALGPALQARGAWIDSQVDQIATWAARAGVDAADILHGLGGGAAKEEADLKRYVRRSETLLIGRAAMIATRAEVVERRAEQLIDREQELQAFEQAFVRAEVRLTARERLLREAISRLQVSARGDVAPPFEPTQTAPEPRVASPASHRHAATVSMSAVENQTLDAAVEGRPESAPPVLDFSADHVWGAGAKSKLTPRFAPSSPSSPPSSPPSVIIAPAANAASPGELHLAGYVLRRSAVEVDRTNGVVLASLAEPVSLSGRVDFVGTNGRGETQCFTVRVQLVMPGNDGVGSAVVLSATGWSALDFDNFEAVLASLP